MARRLPVTPPSTIVPLLSMWLLLLAGWSESKAFQQLPSQQQQYLSFPNAGAAGQGQMFAMKTVNRNAASSQQSYLFVKLIPDGLLDNTLTNRGSFAFNSRLVKFDKLKVLGNVYVNRVNGKPLRELYLFKNNTPANSYVAAQQQQPPPLPAGRRDQRANVKEPTATKNVEQIKLQIV